MAKSSYGGSLPPSPLYFNFFKSILKKPLINNQIRANEVRVIDETGKQLGVMDLNQALKTAQEHNLDLIQVTDKVVPPVCKIGDFGKYLYQLEKKEKSFKRKGGEVKGIRLSFGISDHDLETKANLAEKFLKKGDIVRIAMRLKGREKAHRDFAEEKIKKFIEILDKLIPVKTDGLRKESQGLTMMISKK